MTWRPARSWALIAALLATLAVAGCSSDVERRDAHLAQANSYLDEGKVREALIELRSALKLDPQNPEINFQIGVAMERAGQLQDALFFFGEAYRLDPTDTRAALRQARLLVFDDLDRMEAIVNEVLQKEPDNDHAHVVKSRLELARSDVPAALKSALTAVELAPETSWNHQQVGKVHQARIQRDQLQGDPVPEDVYRAAVQAFQRAAELAQDADRWQNELELAQVLAAWPGHEDEAGKAFRTAVASAEPQGPSPFATALNATASFAEARGDDELARWTLERHVAVAPNALESWTRLAVLEQRGSGNGLAVMDRMLAAVPDDPRAQVRYAQFLNSTGRPEEAVAHLDRAAREGDHAAELLGARANLLIGLGRTDEARATVARLQDQHPEHPSTALARAQLAMGARQYDEAAEILRRLVTQVNDPDAQRLLAGSELRRGDLQAARAAIQRALELEAAGTFAEDTHRLRAEILSRAGDCPGAMQSLGLLRRAGRNLGTPQRLQMAHCLYETGRGDLGRRILTDLIALDEPPLAAVLEYVRREGRARPQVARDLLEKARARQPNNPRLVTQLARFDLADGKPEQALARLNAAIADGSAVTPELVLERARVLAVQGEVEAAQRDALQAFEANPALDGAAELLVRLYRSQGKVDEVIASFEQARAAGALGAPAQALLARLYLATNRPEEARTALEAVVAERSDMPGAKNDLAYLLARDGEDLDRALRLAQEALQALSDRPEVADTLGYVYLKKGLLEPALQQFRYAIELAEREDAVQATYPYHLGLALAGLGLDAAAAEAFERALSLDADFQDAALELRKLRESAELEDGAASAS